MKCYGGNRRRKVSRSCIFTPRHIAVKQLKLIHVVQCFLWVSLCEIARRPLFQQRAVNEEVQICERETRACPWTAAVNKGTRFKSAQTPSVNFCSAYLLQSYLTLLQQEWRFILVQAQEEFANKSVASIGPSVCSRMEKIWRMYRSSREEEKCLLWGGKHLWVNRKCSSLKRERACVG